MKSTPSLTGHARMESPLGPLLLAASHQGLCGLWFEEQKQLPPWLPTLWDDGPPSHPVLKAAAAQLGDYFSGQRLYFDVPLDLRHGTPFQCAVWQALVDIPAHASLSYGALARRIGHPAAVRAVGAAVGRNPVGIIVPCHRVMGANGSLTGYTGGLWRKSALLRLEQGHPITAPWSEPPGATPDLFA